MMALVPPENIDVATLSLSSNPDFIALIERSRARYEPGTGIPIEEVRRQLGLGHPRRRKTTARPRPSPSAKRRQAKR